MVNLTARSQRGLNCKQANVVTRIKQKFPEIIKYPAYSFPLTQALKTKILSFVCCAVLWCEELGCLEAFNLDFLGRSILSAFNEHIQLVKCNQRKSVSLLRKHHKALEVCNKIKYGKTIQDKTQDEETQNKMTMVSKYYALEYHQIFTANKLDKLTNLFEADLF